MTETDRKGRRTIFPRGPLMSDWFKIAAASVGFMLINADMIYPLLFVAPVIPGLLLFSQFRRVLRDPWARAAYVAMPLMWMILIPWGAAFLGAMDVRHASPIWAITPVFIDLIGFPPVAAAFVVRGRGARLLAIVYALFNVPGWFLGWVTGAMAVSGDWI